MADLRYQTVQVENRPIVAGAPSTQGAGVAAGVKLLHKAAKALNGWSVSWRVNNEIEKLRPKIEAVIAQTEAPSGQSRPDAGVLLVVGTQEWAIPDPTGARAQTFLSLHIAGGGFNAADVLERYLMTPRLDRGPADGWRRRDTYVWVTRQPQ